MKEIEQAKLSKCFKDAADVRQIKVHFQFLINEELNGSEHSLKDNLSYPEQMLMPKNVELLLPHFLTIISKILDNFTEFVKGPNILVSNWKTFAQGILNNSFIHNSHPKLTNRII